MIFVGTLESGEGDFEQCKKAIADQKDVQVVHKVISGLSEADAHNALWNSWAEAKSNGCNLFVKIDADTVLNDVTALKTIQGMFQSDPTLSGMQCYLHDYFTNEKIYGLNCFSSSVIFNETKDPLMCDRGIDVGHTNVLRGNSLPSRLNPAASHCFRAIPKQAFHYGVHRSLKEQKDTLQKVKVQWQKSKDDIRMWALLGAKFSTYFTKTSGFNYTDKQFCDIFEFVKSNLKEFSAEL